MIDNTSAAAAAGIVSIAKQLSYYHRHLLLRSLLFFLFFLFWGFRFVWYPRNLVDARLRSVSLTLKTIIIICLSWVWGLVWIGPYTLVLSPNFNKMKPKTKNATNICSRSFFFLVE